MLEELFEVQFLVIFQLLTSNLGHLTELITFLCLSINGISFYIVGLNQICCMPFPFARLLQHHVDFWP